jgi:hypothetical protein
MQPVAAPEPGIRAKYISTMLAPFERIAIDVAGPFSWSDQGNQYLLITMDCFTKWPESYAIANQEASTVAEVLVTNFCLFRVVWELHSDQGHNFESCLIQEVLQHLGVRKSQTTPLQSDSMVESCIRTVKEHL